jgi:hypothetical protein
MRVILENILQGPIATALAVFIQGSNPIRFEILQENLRIVG